MKYIPGGLEKITEAALNYVNVFEHIIHKYLSDKQNPDLSYDCKEINNWLKTVVSDINFKITPELINNYRQVQYRPYVIDLYHKHCQYLITAKKCFEINNKEDKKIIQDYCLELLFENLNRALRLKVLESINLDTYNVDQLKLDFNFFREHFKNNFINEIIENNKSVKLPSTDEIINSPIIDKKINGDGLLPKRNNSLSLLIDNFDNLFLSSKNGTNITKNLTLDSESGEMIVEFVVDSSPTTITNQLPSPLGKFV